MKKIKEIKKFKTLFHQLLTMIEKPGKGQIDHQLNEKKQLLFWMNI